MFAPPSWLLPSLALGIGIGLPLYAGRFRGRTYAIFASVLVLISFPGALGLAVRSAAQVPESFRWGVGWAFVYGMLATGLHFASLVKARLRPRAFRWGVSLPGMAFLALGAVAGPWLLLTEFLRLGAEGLGFAGVASGLAWLGLLPLALVAFSVATSLGLRREIVRIVLDRRIYSETSRIPVERHFRRPPPPTPERPLRVVQIADPHLGPWQPIHRLQARIEELLAHEPDLVLITGDLLTMEGNATAGALTEALAPLKAARGRCFAIFGNHDHEAPEEVRAALAACGAILLMDDEAMVETAAGPVQLVGADWARKERAERLDALAARFPRREGHLRLWLVHDPLGFADLADGEADLVLSGHTHGGQIGLVSFGLDWTVLSRSRWPDHGFFGLGTNRLYVHRGTGFYGFPLRIGVPGEASLLEVISPG
ncbi:MAG: metallophosphoesterase [Deltaproteobacteria bacterium]|nr:metallophosphoesterase [Deltaproteobacteria bacterium]MBW2394357.1 metallophosphoesterase [Deltaproteobacteria bacterium]